MTHRADLASRGVVGKERSHCSQWVRKECHSPGGTLSVDRTWAPTAKPAGESSAQEEKRRGGLAVVAAIVQPAADTAAGCDTAGTDLRC